MKNKKHMPWWLESLSEYIDLRLLLFALYMIAISTAFIYPFCENAHHLNRPLQVMEPIIALTSSRFGLFLLSCGFVMMISDIPLLSQCDRSIVQSKGRISWSMHRMVQIVLIIIGFIVVLTIIIMACMRFNFSISNEWSKPVKAMTLGRRATVDPGKLRMSISSNILYEYLPFEAGFFSVVNLIFLLLFYGLSNMLLRVCGMKESVLILLGFNAIQWLASWFMPGEIMSKIISLLSPLYHANIEAHFSDLSEWKPPTTVGMSTCILLLSVTVLGITNIWASRRRDF